MANKHRLSVSDAIRVHNWVTSRKEEVANNTRQNVLRSIKADTGLDVSVSSLIEFEEAAGIERRRGAAGTPARKDRPSVIAKELVRVMESLGVVPSVELQDIAISQ